MDVGGVMETGGSGGWGVLEGWLVPWREGGSHVRYEECG